MASGAERPDLEALSELEEVLKHLEGELAGWRRRALSAESRLSELVRPGETGAARLEELERENRTFEQRLAQARSRVADLLDRLRFLEQQRGNGDRERMQ
jgi:predicted  nucleic acid-binding Zn-ribbon protein